jgi:thioredoxin 2
MDENMVVCSACGGVNRLAQGHSAAAAKCGKCGRKLFSAHPADVDGTTFHRHRTRSTLHVLVDVWAPWCEPCRRMAPAYEAAARELEPDIALIKLNSEKEPASAAELGIRSIPTMILFRNGKELARQSGAMSSGQIVGWVRDRLRSAAA